MTARVLIDASNLSTGGGVQVGASVVDELAAIALLPDSRDRWPWLSTTDLHVSERVLRNTTADVSGLRITRVDRSWRDAFRPRGRSTAYDVCFTIFGPSYALPRAVSHIVGFADGTSLFPEGVPRPGTKGAAKMALRRRISRSFYRSVDRIVVEAPFVRAEMAARWGIDPTRICVVPNVINAVFSRRHGDVRPFQEDSGVPTFCFIARGYVHKNHDLLGEAAQLLADEHDRRVRFALTLTEQEWSALAPRTRQHSINLGPVDVSEAPAVYRASDGAVFPSLLECFSATPLEALAEGCPLIASDRPFVRDVAGEAAWYFDPEDASDLARTIMRCVDGADERAARSRAGRVVASRWPSARDRAVAYLDLVGAEVDEVTHREGAHR